MLCGLTSHNVNTWNAALGAVLHTHLSALIASLRLKRVGLTYAGRPGGTHVSGQGKAQQMTHRPWHKRLEKHFALVKEQETNNRVQKKKGAKTRTTK